ncbi:MAG: OmpA family protein [Bacteroidia bacterium]
MSKLLLICLFALLSQSLLGQGFENKYTVYFETDKDTPAEKEVLKIGTLNYIKPRDTLSISAYCDSRASALYNIDLAERRLQNVIEYLYSKLNNGDSLVWVLNAFGEENPISSNQTIEGMALNRRVEIEVKQLVKLNESNKLKIKGLQSSSNVTGDLLSKIEESRKSGKSVAIDNLLFKPGLDIIVDKSIPVLKELLEIMMTNADLKIEIHGHVCCTGVHMEDGINNRTGSSHLSKDRAEAVLNYLTDNGIDANRMSTIGFGGSQKLFDPETNEFEQDKNRRVEIKVVSN